jgi:hypothetical protein
LIDEINLIQKWDSQTEISTLKINPHFLGEKEIGKKSPSITPHPLSLYKKHKTWNIGD